MKIAWCIGLLVLFSCTQTDQGTDERQRMLAADFAAYDNFFPLATLDLKEKGIEDPIHVMYVSFDPDIDQESAFPGDDYIDCFSFQITAAGEYRPLFKKSALRIGKSFEGDFQEDLGKFKAAKAANNISRWIDVSGKPGWWQYDQTPLNSKGKPMTFICQIDMGRIINDDCRLFVFYDPSDRVVKYIYQRT